MFFPWFSHDAPGAGPVWTPGARLAEFIKRTLIHSCTQNKKAVGFVVLEKDIFYVFPIVSVWELMTPGTGPCLTPEAWFAGFIKRTTISRYKLWSCQNVCDALSYLLDNIYIRCPEVIQPIFGIPMGTNCAPLAADLFLYRNDGDFMGSRNHDNQADVIESFNSTSRYLDDFFDIDNSYSDGMNYR